MGCSDGEGLSQLYFELVDAYEKRFCTSKWTSHRIKMLCNMEENEKNSEADLELLEHSRWSA